MFGTATDLLLAGTVFTPAVGGLATLRSGHRSGRVAVAGTAVGLTFAALLTGATALDRSASWSLDGRPMVAVDPLGALLLVFVLSSTLVVQSFAVRSLRGDVERPKFFASSGCAAAATATVAIAADLWVMVAAWVLVSAAAAMLLRHDGRPAAVAASRRAATTFLVGDAALVLAAIAASATYGTVTLRPQAMSEVASSGEHVFGIASIAGILAVAAALAAVSRCALPPAHSWLPLSVAAPTPSSAVLHAGIVNGGGVALIRFAPVLAVSPVATGLALAAGCAGVLLGSAVSRTRADVKSSLAWSTVSQMGFMVVQCATGLLGPALIHMVAHGMYKSNLFLGSGSALAQRHRRRRREDARQRRGDRIGHAVAVAMITAVAVGGSWAVVRPTSFEGITGLVFLGFMTVTVAYVASTWLRTREDRSVLDLVAFAALVLFTVTSIAFAAMLERWLAPSLPEVESPLADVGAVALAVTALASWWVSARSNRPGTAGHGISSRAYLWSAHLGDSAKSKAVLLRSPSEVRP